MATTVNRVIPAVNMDNQNVVPGDGQQTPDNNMGIKVLKTIAFPLTFAWGKIEEVFESDQFNAMIDYVAGINGPAKVMTAIANPVEGAVAYAFKELSTMEGDENPDEEDEISKAENENQSQDQQQSQVPVDAHKTQHKLPLQEDLELDIEQEIQAVEIKTISTSTLTAVPEKKGVFTIDE